MKNNVWFISDTHFSDMGALYHSSKRRELAGITLDELQNGDKKEILEKYDKWLIEKWNSTIKKNDMVYIIGDFCLANTEKCKNLVQKLNGKKWLILGNHDKTFRNHKLDEYFMWVGDVKEAKFNHDQFPFIKEGETFCVEMFHFPMSGWNRKPYGTVHACGHEHGAHDEKNDKSGDLIVDVGLDAKLANYDFISLEKLYNHFRNIVTSHGFDSFQEYIEYFFEKQGNRD